MPSHVIYARKSTESEDRQVLSIDSQVRELRTLAARRGLTVNEVLTETKSAKAPGRPVFGQLMRRVHRGDIRSVICWKMDRLARNHLDTGAILQALADGKLDEVITSDRTYTRDGNDRFMGNFELGMATKFIDDLRANVRRGNRARLAQGWVNHNPPLGYLLDPVTKTIVKDPARYDLVRRMFECVLEGTMPSNVLRTANDKWGFRTRQFKRIGGRPLARAVFFRMLGDPFYMGVIRLRSGETFAGAHPTMLTQEEFERIQAIMGRTGRTRPKRHSFAFAGVLKCGKCGGTITAEQHLKKSGRRYVYYHCSRQKAGVKCKEPALSEAEVQAQLARALARMSMPSRVHTWLVRQLEKDDQLDQARSQSVLDSLTAALGSAKREMENLVSMRLKEQISEGAFLGKRAEITDRIASLESKLRAPARSGGEVRSLAVATLNFVRQVVELFENSPAVQKRAILETVGLNYTLTDRKVQFSFKKPFQILADAAANSDWCTTRDDVRTWLQDTTEYFALPNLDAVGTAIAQPTA